MLRMIKAHWRHPHASKPPRFLAPDDRIWPPPKGNRQMRDDNQSYCDFLDLIGAVGMGGSQFPTSKKIAVSKNIDTLVINAVECEPGITIDKALLLHHSEYIKAGANASAECCGAKKIVIAIARNKRFEKQLSERYPYKIIRMPKGYPGGAEKLIVRKITGKTLALGRFPGSVGILVQNTASMRAIGRALIDHIPVIERPLTISVPHRSLHHNLIVPVGVTIGSILKACEVDFAPAHEILIAGGLMMGRRATRETEVTKGTTSIMIMPNSILREKERNCINCGACAAVCPLKLHPISIVREVRDTERKLSKAAIIQIKTCFNCGACTAVCPSHIPLLKHIKEGRECL